jgi:hypothetical protein
MEFTKVFDLVETGYRTWNFAAFGLIFVAIGTITLFAPIVFKKLNISYIGFDKKSYKFFKWIFLLFSIFWTVTSFSSTYSEYKNFRNILESNSFKIVEGQVEQFDPMPHSGHKDESFLVDGIKFAYSDYWVTNAFNNTKSHGGPINENSYVKISYASGSNKNYILRLEIKDYNGPIKNYSSGFSPFPWGKRDNSSNPEPHKTNFPSTSWYDNFFIYIVILDLFGILFFVIPYWKTFITLRKTNEIEVIIPSHIQKGIKQSLQNTVLKWDLKENTIWMRPKAMNLLHIPCMVTKWSLNREQTQIVKQEVKISSGIILALFAMGFSMLSFFNKGLEGVNNLPTNLDLVMILFLIIASIINGWLLSRRMLSLSEKTIESSFE